MLSREITDVFMHRPNLEGLPSLSTLGKGYDLRQLGEGNEKKLAQLLTLAYGEPWSDTRASTELIQAADVNAVYGIFVQDTLVATSSSQYQPEFAFYSGFVHWVGTHPEYRQQGLASALLYRVLKDFTDRGYESAWLVTQPERLPAIQAYLKFGFVPMYSINGVDHKMAWSRILQRIATRSRS